MLDDLMSTGVQVDADALFKLRHLVRNVPERRLATTGRPGGFAGKRRGTGLETVDVRPFFDGDDIRHVDAATTARTGRAHVKTFRDEREKTALLVSDFRPAMLWGTRRRLRSVAAAEALALAGWRVIEAGGRVGLLAIGAGEPLYVPPRARAKGMAEVAGGLSRAHAAAIDAAAAGNLQDPSLSEALERAVRMVPVGSTLFLATGLDEPGADFDALVLALRRRASLVVLLVRDGFETRAPRGAYPFLTGPGAPSASSTSRSADDRKSPTVSNRTSGLDATMASLRWAFIAGNRDPAPGADDRIARLQRLGAEIRIVDAEASAEAMATTLADLQEVVDAGRS